MNIDLRLGNCLDVMRTMGDNSVDSIVTDPPYGLGFMGKKWDYDVPSVEIWGECLRVLKPGGHLLAFAGTRTQHRMAVRIEDAGFEIRDMIAWVYGCLDTETQVATIDGVKHYHETKIGDLVLCYDVLNKEYTYQPILEIVEYDYNDTAYRISGDFVEQVVSRNHRCIIERSGKEVFGFAETLESEVHVPFLESLSELQQSILSTKSNTSIEKQNMQQELPQCDDRKCQHGTNAIVRKDGEVHKMCCMRKRSLETGRLVEEIENTNLQLSLQRDTAGTRLESSCTQRQTELDSGIGNESSGKNDWIDKSSVEGWCDIHESERTVFQSVDQVCTVSDDVLSNESQGWICDGTPIVSCNGNRTGIDPNGSCSSYQSRCNGQSVEKSDVISDERRTQGIREWKGHTTSLVRVVPFQYVGKVWCLRVSTGAFVAVRNGVAFPTGNSGFPKSQNISKSIDKAAGAEREVIGINEFAARRISKLARPNTSNVGGYVNSDLSANITASATDEAKQWDGWGTALKPALEPITVARKPLSEGTVAANVLKHGTGGINIDDCRVPLNGDYKCKPNGRPSQTGLDDNYDPETANQPDTVGRWPANFILSYDADEYVLIDNVSDDEMEQLKGWLVENQ